MFGQNNDNQAQPFQDAANVTPAGPNPPSTFFNPSNPTNNIGAPIMPPTQDNNPVLADPNPTDFTAPSTPMDGPAPEQNDNPVATDDYNSPAPAPTPAGGTDDLLSMKQAALQQLNPLVNHLDQNPEEKFRTVMMMIQATDDHTKLGEAFEAAKQIPEDKARAQALLDVINEINYFTQHSN